MAASGPSPVSSLWLCAVVLLVNAEASEAFTNYSVGGDAGWFFDQSSNKNSADYRSWAANITFNLGDYLIFNTNTNQTVIQTFNETTYNSCSTDDALDSDTFQFDGGNMQFGAEQNISIPLTVKGTQYYFSDASDGEQCQHGMAFEIKVNVGIGLPPSLNQPPPPPALERQLTPPTDVTDVTPNLPNDGGVESSFRLYWFAFLILFSFSFLA